MNYEAAAQKDARPSKSGFTCNIDGIPAKYRAHYEQLVESLRHAILEIRGIGRKVLTDAKKRLRARGYTLPAAQEA